MRALGLAPLLLLLVVAAGCTDDGGTSGTFTVLSYNVAGLPQEISPENPEEHIPLISPLLDRYDVVLTQEDFDWWGPLLDGLDFASYHARLRAGTTHRYQTGRHPGPDAVGITSAVRPTVQVGDGLGVLSRFPLSDEVRVAWPGCFGGLAPSDGGAADCLAVKGFAKVTLELVDLDDDDPDPGPLVDVYTLHAEAGATIEDQRLQEEDFAILADYIAEHSVDRAVIVGGDTNLHTEPGHPDGHGDADATTWAQFLDRTGLTDACAALDCGEPDSVDKVAFRSGAGLDLEAEALVMPRDLFTDGAGDDLSDHPPLVVTVRWNAKAR